VRACDQFGHGLILPESAIIPRMKIASINIQRYYRYALWLGILTVVYNVFEGLFSIYFGAQDETLTLFGFGLDSFIEVLSGLGIVVMILRMRRHPEAPESRFEKIALRITGISFYLLIAGLAITSVYNVVTNHKPETSLPGIIISIISLSMMWALVAGKRKVGRALDSAPILADANCSLVCIYMSLVLLAASLIYEFTGFGLVDSIGALGLIYFSFTEGREAFEKANSMDQMVVD
jgi:divalent metal cation (Fe/Co/Zn/Cd) transporter